MKDSSWCTFRLGTALYAVEVALVQSVSTMPPLTPVPHTPDCVRGYVNLRGQVHLVLDIKSLLLVEPTEITATTRLVLFKPSLGDPAGALVDAVGDIVTLSAEQIEDPRGLEAGIDAELLVGVGKLARELVVLLDGRKLLPRVEQAVRT